MRTSAPQFGNHIIIKAPAEPMTKQVLGQEFNALCTKTGVAPVGLDYLVASCPDTATDDVFIQFAKDRNLPYANMGYADPVEALKKGRQLISMIYGGNDV